MYLVGKIAQAYAANLRCTQNKQFKSSMKYESVFAESYSISQIEWYKIKGYQGASTLLWSMSSMYCQRWYTEHTVTIKI